jgi:signal peptidase I
LLAGGWIGFLALLLSLRIFFFQPFNMPSASMYPSLQIGDAFLVSKTTYNSSEPERGDVVVFWAQDFHSNFVKRVIGIPGDHIRLSHGRVFLNGAEIPNAGPCDTGFDCPVLQFEETYPGGRPVRILKPLAYGPLDNTETYAVPQSAYFVLGDNRDNSNDSREAIGFVPRSAVIGRVVYKYAANGHWTWQPVH